MIHFRFKWEDIGMDFPEVDHNPPMDYPGSMSEVLGCCLDSAPRAGAQGEFAAFCCFPVLALPFVGRASCSRDAGETLQRQSPSLAEWQEGFAERGGWEPLKPISLPEPPGPQSPTPTLGTRHTNSSWLLSAFEWLDWAKTVPFLCSQVSP